jgi:glycosyltransferase involved in cell wall biosynthesis
MKVFVYGTRGFPNIQGGVEKHCEALYAQLPPSVELTVFRRKPYVNGDACNANIRFVDLPSTTVKGFEALWHSLLATLYTLLKRPDVAHIHNIGPALFSPLLKLFGLRVVVTYHSPNYNHKKWGLFARNLLRLSEKITFACADRIIYVNRQQMELAPASARRKSVYIPNGVSAFAACSPEEVQEVMEEFGLRRGHYVVGVGRLTDEKGFDLLIEAFGKADNSHRYKLAIVGDNPSDAKYCAWLHDLARGYDDIVFTGSQQGKRLAALFEGSALYVLSSRNEGFPLVLLEAMSFGKAVIASDIVRSLPLGLTDADLFASGSAEDLQRALSAKLASPHIAPRHYDLSLYDWSRIAAQTLAVYEEAMGED